MRLQKVYDPKKVEDKIYALWEKSGFFNPDKLPGKRKKSYTIVIPPPNITGELHMGHALNALIQDILIRWKRLEGFKTLWLPGTDHAGIAAQNVVEKELKKEGRTRFDLGRKKFQKRMWQWMEKYGDIIIEQFKKIGVSADWSRLRFTLDKEYCKAVQAAFFHYYQKGWIYKGKRVINWCPRCQTSLSDLELEYRQEKGKLWYIKYPLKKIQNSIVVATTRPETMLGDTAVAVNPQDKRYKNLIGKKVILPLVNRELPIIADKLVDPKFGTGAVKVTPAHDLQDYEISLRHNLAMIQVINEEAKISKEAPLPYQGLSVLAARQKVVGDLKNLGLLERVKDYTYQLPCCDRCKTIIEPIPSEQWFLKMKDLAKMAEAPVRRGEIKFHPKSFEKGYFNWLKNIRDWCISRQIWWGHKIPLKGVDDVLDTWFSSALWPFAVFGWPIACAQNQKSKIKNRVSIYGSEGEEENEVLFAHQKYCKPKRNSDLAKFYPTDVLSTDRGIINLWVARMIFSGREFMRKIPFKDVYIHATVLTKEGKRMSKSLGTGVDPLNLIEKYGADATRFGIAYQIMGGQDIRFSEENIIMGKKFCNKIWNASRFVLQQISKSKIKNQKSKIQIKIQKLNKNKFTLADRKILKSLDQAIKSVNRDLENFRFGQAAHKLYHFFWHDFCDIYIEESKKQLSDKIHHGVKCQTEIILLYLLLNSLRILHPFLPFITEEIYQKLPVKNKKKCLMIEEWP